MKDRICPWVKPPMFTWIAPTYTTTITAMLITSVKSGCRIAEYVPTFKLTSVKFLLATSNRSVSYCCLLNALPLHLVGNQQWPSRRFATQNLPAEHRYSQVHFSHHGHRSTCQGLSWKVFSHPKPCRIAEKITQLWSQSYALKSIYFEIIYLKLSII